MTNVVEILITAKDLAGPAMDRVNAKVNGVSKGMAAFHKTALIAGAGLAAIGFESVKMAAKFDASMAQLHTQAGVSQSKIAGLKKGVLDLAGKVGQDPDSLAESLYHVESNFESTGISGSRALKLVETAAKGATVGHADLVDVTNALTAAVASGIPGVQDMDKAMGVLNATVGVGDMKMQDLADAFGTGMLATVKGFGVTIEDVSAGLALLGDNNIRGAAAGTQFRMMIQSLAHPVATAGDALQKLGLQQDTLRNDMQKGGMKLALQDLVEHMHKAGISAKEQGGIITDAFGKKAGTGLNIAVGEFEKLMSKYPAATEGANKFGSAWAATQKTFAFQMKSLQSSFDALMISLGTKLIPPLQSFVSLLLAHKGAATAAAAGLAALLAATVAVSAAMKVAAAATMLWNGAMRGFAAVQAVFQTVALRAMYMRDAFLAAGGGIAGLKAAFMELGMVGKATVAVAGFTALALVLMKLSSIGKQAPPDVNKLTTSLTQLAETGKASGEAARVFGTDFGQLGDSLRTLARPSNLDKTQQFLTQLIGMDSTPVKNAKEAFNGLDEALTGMVNGGKADEAKAALQDVIGKLKSQGFTSKEVMGQLDDYKNALAGQAVEQKLAAKSMGLFGDAAVSTQQALEGEAQSAKGLEQSIMALNAVHRGAYDAETAFYQAMSDAKKAVKDNGKTLDVTTEAGRKNRDVLSQLAARTEDLVDKKMKEKTSWAQVDKIYKQGRQSLIDTARAMGDNKQQAEELADAILKAPDAKKFKFKVDDKQATADLNAFNAAVKKSPGARSVTLKTLSTTAEHVLEAFGFKVTHLKNGSVKITAQTGAALSAINNVQHAVDAMHGKSIGIGVFTTNYQKTVDEGTVHYGPQLPGMPGAARGGLLRGYAGGGGVQMFPDGGYVQGPGSGTSDSILALMGSGAMARVSNTEYVMKAEAVRKYGVKFFDALNEGRLHVAGFARGGHLTKAQRAAQEQAKAEHDAQHQLGSEFGISYFGRLAGYKRTPFEHNLGAPTDINALVDALNHAAGEIKASFHGRTESNLLKHLNSVGKSLINHEKALAKVTASLEKAKDKLNSLKDSASQLSDSVKSNLISSANITKAASGNEGGTLTLSAVRAQMVVSRDKVTAFANALKALKAKGYSKSVIQQVAEAGIDGGGLETAGALLQASASEVKSMNSLQGQIESAAGSAGKTTASAVYDAAIKAQTKVVDKLTKQQASLEKAMAALAKSMEKLIQKALGHKAAGGVVGMAASGGLRSSLTWVGEQGPELLDLPAGSRVFSNPDSRRMWAEANTPWSSMLTTRRHASTSTETVPAAGAGQPIVIQVSIAGKDFGELWVDAGRQAVRARGSIEATLRPPRGR
jgi:TP901 family phage tail tape measure protein